MAKIPARVQDAAQKVQKAVGTRTLVLVGCAVGIISSQIIAAALKKPDVVVVENINNYSGGDA